MGIIEDVGYTITITEVTRTIDSYGDATESTSTSNVTGYINTVTMDDELVKSGVLSMGDAIGYFRATDSGLIKPGNRALDSSTSLTYEIHDVQTHVIGGVKMHIEAGLKRVLP